VLTNKTYGMFPGEGAFAPNRGFRPADFSDGLSNTVGIAEVKGYTVRVTGSAPASSVPPASPADIGGFSLAAFDPAKNTHVEWVDGKVHETGFTTTFPPNTPVIYSGYDVDYISATETNLGDTCAAVTSRSYHQTGVNVVLMDGSVRFISNGTSITTWRALGTRAGGEVVNDF
jgi:prepilin-type processing-associated H-X9-DG protein